MLWRTYPPSNVVVTVDKTAALQYSPVIQRMLGHIHSPRNNEALLYPFLETTALCEEMPCILVRGSKRFRLGPWKRRWYVPFKCVYVPPCVTSHNTRWLTSGPLASKSVIRRVRYDCSEMCRPARAGIQQHGSLRCVGIFGALLLACSNHKPRNGFCTGGCCVPLLTEKGWELSTRN